MRKPPIQRRGNKVILRASRDLYSQGSLDQAIKEFSNIARKIDPGDKRYQRIELNLSRLRDALEWGNYLFLLNR